MASNGIKDRVAIVGMGCTPFGEHWDKGAEDLLVDAARDAYQSAGIDPEQVDAYWLGTMASGTSGLMLSEALKIPYKPVTRLENMCATGSEAIRNAAYAVASGAYDLVMAIGVEKLKDSGYSGLIGSNPPNDGTLSNMTAPATFSLLAPAYAKKYGVEEAELKQVLARIAWKNHKNGAKNPKAQFRKEVPIETIAKSAPVAGMLGIFDCSGVSDGSAAAILCRAEDAHKYSKHPIFMKALSFAAGPAHGYYSQDYDFTTFPEVVASSRGRLQAGRRARPARRDQHGRGARLLHAHRAGADGGHGLLAARSGVEGRARRPLRRRRPAADQSRRRAQELRPSDRRERAAHDVRDVAPAAGRSGSAADQGPEARADAQPRRRAGTVRELRVDRRRVATGRAASLAPSAREKPPVAVSRHRASRLAGHRTVAEPRVRRCPPCRVEGR